MDPSGTAEIVNNTGRPIEVTGNPGLGRGAGAQAIGTIPANPPTQGEFGPGPVYGGSNPVACHDGSLIYDIDYVEGIKVRGNEYFPVYHVNEATNSYTGKKEIYFVPDPGASIIGLVRSILNPGSMFH